MPDELLRVKDVIMIRQQDTFSISEFFYALNLEGITTNVNRPKDVQASTYVDVPALWFKRKSRIDTVVKGSIGGYVRGEVYDPIEAFEALIEQMDGRYGGYAHYRWDGTYMWAPEKTWDDVVSVQSELATHLIAHLENWNDVPAGYAGWYSIKH
jgi:hypothetical protein